MKVNKWIIIGSIFVGLSGLIAIVIPSNSIIENIGISLLAGAIVSFVTSVLYYVYERQAFLSKIKSSLPFLFVNLSVIKNLTGNTISKVTSVTLLSSLSFNVLVNLAEDNIASLSEYQTGVFSGLLPKSKTNERVQQFEKYILELRNLKYCLTKIYIFALDADNMSYQLCIKQQYGQIILPEENNAFRDKRDLVTIQISKVHEYEASLLQKLDELGNQFFKMDEWNRIKKDNQDSIAMLVNEAQGIR